LKLDFECDDGSASKAALGLIVLKADETIEAEFRSLFDSKDVALYHTRIESAAKVTPETLLQMKARLCESAALLPGNRPLEVIGYACTSGATVIGSDAVSKAVRKAHPSANVTDPARALIAALHHLGVSKIGVVSPYVAEVSEAVCNLLRENGFVPAKVGSFGQAEESVVARITLDSVEEAICAVGNDPEVEVVFASCTNLRTMGVIDRCEKRLGKPVLSSNQVLAWHMMKLVGLPINGAGPGRLFNA
jgi:maleate isomerase